MSHSPRLYVIVITAFDATHLRHPVLRHERQEGGQIRELESQERTLQETVEADVVAVTVATDRHWA